MFEFNQQCRDKWIASHAGKVPPGSRVLDVGAGDAPYRSLFSHCSYETHDFCQLPGCVGKYGQVDYVSDITSIPISSESVDLIVCTEVLEHVPEPIRAVQEMARILRLGGNMLLTAPLGSFLHQEPFHFYGGYTPHWYKRFLPESGLAILEIEPNRGFFSWFGQEARRYSALIDPRRTLHTRSLYPFLVSVWLITLPFCRLLFPMLGKLLDTLSIERIATVGYHVHAKKVGSYSRL
jgi:SAM-dependent methyltransferase